MYVQQGVLSASQHWAMQSAPLEWLGLLAGRPCRDGIGPYTLVTGVVSADNAVQRRGSVFLDPETTRQTRARLHRCYPTAELVGWVHSHPGGIGTHFSGTDRNTQRRFQAAYAVGIVVDPEQPHPGSLGVYLGPASDRLSLLCQHCQAPLPPAWALVPTHRASGPQ